MWRYIKEKAGEIYDRVFRPIPPEFYSFETGEPFSSCVECKGDLGGEDSDYIIEKCYRGDEVIIEYALCDECAKCLRKELSRESLKHLRHALRGPALKSTIDACRMCALPRHELPDYSIIGTCLGQHMIFWDSPMLLCEPCLERIVEGLSKQTQDVLDDFEERNFPGPPELELDLPKPKRKAVFI